MEITPAINTNFLQIDESVSLSQMIGKLKESDKKSGLIFQKGKYMGILDKKRILQTKLDSTNVGLSKFIQRTPMINEHADIIETSAMMFKSNIDLLPVERQKQVIGVISSLNLAKIGSQLPETSAMKVKDCTLDKPTLIQKDDSIARAIEIMYQEHTEHIPIFDKGKLYGIISSQDVLKKYLSWPSQRSVSSRLGKGVGKVTRGSQTDTSKFALLPIENLSTNQDLVTISSKSSLKDAVSLMVKKNISALIVMDGNKLIGLLPVKNVLRAIGSLEIPENFNIKFVGLKELDWHSYDVTALKKIAGNEAFKLQRALKNDFDLVIHMKEYQKDAKKHKYSVHMKVEFPGRIVTVSQDDWDWKTAVRKTFANAKNKVGKQFKGK
ncbi:MAG: CBS domain-containing protein [archaeon]|nr:CBS domain-containing protein [archaeon]